MKDDGRGKKRVFVHYGSYRSCVHGPNRNTFSLFFHGEKTAVIHRCNRVETLPAVAHKRAHASTHMRTAPQPQTGHMFSSASTRCVWACVWLAHITIHFHHSHHTPSKGLNGAPLAAPLQHLLAHANRLPTITTTETIYSNSVKTMFRNKLNIVHNDKHNFPIFHHLSVLHMGERERESVICNFYFLPVSKHMILGGIRYASDKRAARLAGSFCYHLNHSCPPIHSNSLFV